MTTVRKGSWNPGESRAMGCCATLRIKATAPESKSNRTAVSAKKRAMK